MIIRQQLVTGAARKTFEGKSRKVGITIHETANTAKGATAAAHANVQSRGNQRDASWHWTVDDKEAVQSYEHDARCWHAGSGTAGDGDDTVAIEICVNEDGDYLQAVKNAAELVRHIYATDRSVGSSLWQHNHWSGKNCPTRLREGTHGVTWLGFLALVAEHPVVTPKPTAPAAKPKRKPRQVPQVRKGGSGTWERRWQGILVASGYALKTDGSFGPATDTATRKWQGKHGLVADGVVGPRTWCEALGIEGAILLGDKGAEVYPWQYVCGVTEDGSFGPATEAATREVQRFLGVADDGAVGPQTRAALLNFWI